MIKVQIQRRHGSWHIGAALACFAVAVLGVAFGSLFTTDWVLKAQLHPWLHAIGLTLLILAIPILILGGHCLDLMDQQKHSHTRTLKDKQAH